MSATTDPVWDAVSLTLAVAGLGIVVTVAGVLVAALSWRWRAGYAVLSLVLAISLFAFRRVRNPIIRFLKRRVPAV